MDEPPSPLLKSRIPRKTVIVDYSLPDGEFGIYDLHCPLRKGIICYRRNGTIFEHNIHSSARKHEPRIIVPKHPPQRPFSISFVPIRGNRILVFAKYIGREQPGRIRNYYLHLSIHGIRSDHRIGSALWSFHGSIDGYLDNNLDLKVIKSTENELGITFWARFDNHWKLFDISTAEADASKNFPLIESGRIDFDLRLKYFLVTLSPETRILLNVDANNQPNETVDIHYLDPGGTNFSFVTRMSIPSLKAKNGSGRTV
ncbi:uncharacterized protein LACBIDRAFT_304137 [Laccaria bicolor S238N-H82]|uniref:Predicted protein n=1 Tax=Laccaria bicolor (strain S238N-H82 / ATCC MYA-4686) TaxID=486041 RepID=B0DL13_LACBS|nr:uncharacterized protein LACBIDRAFT_304137 [Laccaria bicolor S238N-H82]EDR04832.1 predicted protein [Laccaria bicolor S238N-H82]|eukprot:XP_001884656.1 predicted protein [Laccaria bicolor S238N-H82]